MKQKKERKGRREATSSNHNHTTQIATANDVVTLINVFTVSDRRHQKKLIKLLEDVTEKVMRHLDGFVSANIHRSTDGTRVVNYAQWRSVEAFEAMLRDIHAQEHMSKAYMLAHSDPHLYEVVSIYHQGPRANSFTSLP